MGQVRPDAATAAPWTAKRRPRPHLRKIVRAKAVQTGALVMAWNEAHGELFDVFRWLAAGGDFEAARGQWLVLQSDDLRRKAVLAAAEAMNDRPVLKRAIGWAVEQLSTASEHRHFAVHVYFRDWGESIEPDYFSTADKKLDKMESQRWLADLPALTGDLYAIADYLRGTSLALGMARPRPLVRKPRLISRRLVDAARNRAKARARTSRGRSSG